MIKFLGIVDNGIYKVAKFDPQGYDGRIWGFNRENLELRINNLKAQSIDTSVEEMALMELIKHEEGSNV